MFHPPTRKLRPLDMTQTQTHMNFWTGRTGQHYILRWVTFWTRTLQHSRAGSHTWPIGQHSISHDYAILVSCTHRKRLKHASSTEELTVWQCEQHFRAKYMDQPASTSFHLKWLYHLRTSFDRSFQAIKSTVYLSGRLLKYNLCLVISYTSEFPDSATIRVSGQVPLSYAILLQQYPRLIFPGTSIIGNN